MFNPFGIFRVSIFTYIDHTQSLMPKWINCIGLCFFFICFEDIRKYLFWWHERKSGWWLNSKITTHWTLVVIIIFLFFLDLAKDEKNGLEKIALCFCDERICQKFQTELLMSVTRDKIKVQACIHFNCTVSDQCTVHIYANCFMHFFYLSIQNNQFIVCSFYWHCFHCL